LELAKDVLTVAILGIRGNKFMRESIFSVARINFLSVRHREALEKKIKNSNTRDFR
jgi:hypothetical protein